MTVEMFVLAFVGLVLASVVIGAVAIVALVYGRGFWAEVRPDRFVIHAKGDNS